MAQRTDPQEGVEESKMIAQRGRTQEEPEEGEGFWLQAQKRRSLVAGGSQKSIQVDGNFLQNSMAPSSSL